MPINSRSLHFSRSSLCSKVSLLKNLFSSFNLTLNLFCCGQFLTLLYLTSNKFHVSDSGQSGYVKVKELLLVAWSKCSWARNCDVQCNGEMLEKQQFKFKRIASARSWNAAQKFPLQRQKIAALGGTSEPEKVLGENCLNAMFYTSQSFTYPVQSPQLIVGVQNFLKILWQMLINSDSSSFFDNLSVLTFVELFNESQVIALTARLWYWCSLCTVFFWAYNWDTRWQEAQSHRDIFCQR